MLGDKHWYAVPDDTIETWCLLILETTTIGDITKITGWHVGCGNPRQLTYKNSTCHDSSRRELDVLEDLLDEIRPLRRAGRTLVTPSNSTLSLLRTRLLIASPDSRTLRGFSHFSIAEILERQFELPSDVVEEIVKQEASSIGLIADWCTDTASSKSVHREPLENLWFLLTRLGPLVPSKELAGTPI